MRRPSATTAGKHARLCRVILGIASIALSTGCQEDWLPGVDFVVEHPLAEAEDDAPQESSTTDAASSEAALDATIAPDFNVPPAGYDASVGAPSDPRMDAGDTHDDGGWPTDSAQPSSPDAGVCGAVVPTQFRPITVTCPDAGVITYASNLYISRHDMDTAYAALPSVAEYIPQAGRFQHMPRTLQALCCGMPLRVTMLGDSIINSTSQSRWEEYLNEGIHSNIQKTTAIRGSTGSLTYVQEPMLYCSAMRLQPDLLILGGISEIDIASLRSMIQQARAVSDTEILLMTPVWGRVNPTVPAEWTEAVDPAGAGVRAQLRRLADEQGVAFFDMAAPWGRFINASGRTVASFKGDDVHPNIDGVAVTGKLMIDFFDPRAGVVNECDAK
ncbi:MAG: hypothetical protein RL385_773 [Pseudomonadota bacterium]